MLQELQDLGLSEKEAKIYLAALEIVRPTTYLQIKSLMEKGLMSTYEEGKKTYFAPESPEALRRVLQQQKESIQSKVSELDRLLPGLTQLFDTAGERPLVRFFPGKEGVAAVREEVLTTKEKKLYIVFSPENLSRLFGEKYLDDYSERRKALGIHSQGIYTYKENFDRVILDNLTERRSFHPDVIPLSVDLFIFDDKLAVLSLEGALFGLIIQSTQITSSMKAIFNFLWSQAKGLHS
jgi:sugar-specific transcriptional regulator TrmB